MGVAIGDLLVKEEIAFNDLAGKRLAIDAYNTIHQFLSIIRQPDGTPLMDSHGRVTSHLSGLLYRTAKFVEAGIQPCFVFDGKPPALKARTTAERHAVRAEAKEKWAAALEKGDFEQARKHAQAAVSTTPEIVASSQELIEAMGIPHVQAPSEGEAQASFMCQRGDVYATASQDYDALLFGSPVLVRNLAVTGKRKLPGRGIYVEVEPERIELKATLSALGIKREALVEIGLMVGTDYNNGIPRVGPKTALKLVQEGKKAEEVYREKGIEPDAPIEEVRSLFLKPPVTEDYSLEWKKPDVEQLFHILVDEHGFSRDRVEKAIHTLSEKLIQTKEQSRLGEWFK
ncbi:flap endonuclease-1 [Candidatus Micrarchaeota archaeon]|nr:flap endonuclease-1 [Candidatus Micrarchaeota archaeon]